MNQFKLMNNSNKILWKVSPIIQTCVSRRKKTVLPSPLSIAVDAKRKRTPPSSVRWCSLWSWRPFFLVTRFSSSSSSSSVKVAAQVERRGRPVRVSDWLSTGFVNLFIFFLVFNFIFSSVSRRSGWGCVCLLGMVFFISVSLPTPNM